MSKGTDTLSKADRTKCYEARDEYFNCFDSNSASTSPEKICAKFKSAFDANCPAVWVCRWIFQFISLIFQVRHFERKHNIEKYKAEIVAANWQQPLPEGGPKKPTTTNSQ